VPHIRRQRLIVGISSIAILATHAWIFGRFFPDASGHLGPDYHYFLLRLLDGNFWIHQNGYLSIPWFTPGFCAGLPHFGNHQSLYFSVPQLLTLAIDPLASIRLTFFLFGAMGYVGMYLLLRRSFSMNRAPAVLGATLFLFNGAYTSRMLVGHLTFHSFMLVPMLSLLLHGGTSSERKGDPWRNGAEVVSAGLLIAYMAICSLPLVLFQALTAVVLIAFLDILFGSHALGWRRFAGRLSAASLLAICFTLAKLVAIAAFLGNSPRDFYLLAGIDSPGALILSALSSLFYSPPVGIFNQATINYDFHLGPQELDYGITLVPLYLIALLGLTRFTPGSALAYWANLSRDRRVASILLAVGLTTPLALNFYTPGWNEFLKSLPVLRSSSTLVRWFSVYIPTLILLAMLSLDRSQLGARSRLWIVLLSIPWVIVQSSARDRSFEGDLHFDPAASIATYHRVWSGAWTPRIDRISEARKVPGKGYLVRDRDKSLLDGASQLLCYEPTFGYAREHFQRGSLFEGPALEERDGVLNLKNPACYVYPEENGCRPGDHFRADERARAEAFTRYRPFEFRLSRRQRLANVVSATSLGASFLFLSACGIRAVVLSVKRRQRS
jgi:hypothetical protein